MIPRHNVTRQKLTVDCCCTDAIFQIYNIRLVIACASEVNNCKSGTQKRSNVTPFVAAKGKQIVSEKRILSFVAEKEVILKRVKIFDSDRLEEFKITDHYDRFREIKHTNEAISAWTFKKEDDGRFFVGQVGDAYSWGINTHLRCYCLRIHVFGLAGHVTQAATRIIVR
ncbi:hypothetical protein DBV15_05362 [Temnothorax longispinosus]|uniref:Uncharacterized protein n=1 Tax=Temnothorax longispinosus TaxID=300112 RepID=A0A4S2L3S2_9HYME|nr:hypothetical protein DBV15_05362 [Temnothorax longispinosus]